MKEQPNIIFIMIDTLRAKNLGCYGYHRNTSQNIDELAKQGVIFTNCFSSHNVSYDSLFSIFSGRYIQTDGGFRCYPNKKEFLSFFNSGGVFFPEIMKKAGYKNYLLKKHRLYGWERQCFEHYFKEEIDEKSKKWKLIRLVKKISPIYKILKFLYYYLSPKKMANKLRYNPSSEIITQEAIKILNELKENEKIFLWIHYHDVHGPYNYPGQFGKKFVTKQKKQKSLLQILSENKNYNKKEIEFWKGCLTSGESVEDLKNRYDSSIAYEDYLVGKIIEIVKEKKLLENTIIFIFADHAESLDEHELYFTHAGLYESSIHIPLIILGKGIPKDKKIKNLVQLEDLAPTVLSLLKINYDESIFDGKNLIPLIQGKKQKIRDFIFAEERSSFKKRAIRTHRYNYMESPSKKDAICKIYGKIHGGVIELYDLKKDPHENINIAKTNPKILIKMKKKFNEYLRDLSTINEKRRISSLLNTDNLYK